MEFNIPQSLKLEHEELHAELTMATQVSGKIGDAAKAVAKILLCPNLKIIKWDGNYGKI